MQNHFLLKSVYRQSDEGIPLSVIVSLPNASLEFIYALDRCRIADLDDKSVALLANLSRPISPSFLPNYDTIYLFPTRKEVENFNKRRLLSIKNPVVTFQSCDWCSDKRMLSLLNGLPVASSVGLKIGAQVMLVRNLDEGLTNGTIGIVKGFYTYREATGDESYRKKVGFVRNIRVTDKGVPVSCSNAQHDPSTSTHTPLVEFHIHNVTEHVLVLPMEFQVEFDGKPAVKRFQVGFIVTCNPPRCSCGLQIPLILAWAITIHKSQGQSFEKLVVDLSRVFARGKTINSRRYVIHCCHRSGVCCPLACTIVVWFTSHELFTLQGWLPTLSTQSFIADQPKVRANPVALKWYKDTFVAS